MARTVSIPLKSPIRGPNRALYKNIVLREPTFDETLLHEDPVTYSMTPGGNMMVTERPDIIRAFVDICLVEPPDPALLVQADMHAARKVRQAVRGFFQDGETASEVSET